MNQASLLLNYPRALRFAVHDFVRIEGASFDTAKYSRLKFGSGRIAREFGYEMADRLFAAHRGLLERPCVVIPAPSTTVPVAATLLSRHLRDRLNSRLAQEGAHPVEWTLVHRNMVYNNNYADLPKEARQRLLAKDTIYINRSFVEGKFLIFVDDCRITGAHEEKIGRCLRDEGLINDHMFVCYANYVGDDPSIEARLNHVGIKDLADLIDLSNEPLHEVTTRAIRLLLEAPSADLERLLDRASDSFVEEAYHAAIVKSYHVYPAYIANFRHLAQRAGAPPAPRPYGAFP